MISELFIYGKKDSVFKDIVAQLPDMQDRYHVSPDYGHDLNTGNLKSFIKDEAYGIIDVRQKYPICVCVTPRSKPQKINSYRWEQFFFSLFFLERTGYIGDREVRDKDEDTQLSQDTPPDSWDRMKQDAMNFLDLLESTLQGYVTTEDGEVRFSQLLNGDFDNVSVRRLSNFNNDKLSGVELSFSMYLSIAACEIIIGDITYIVNTFLPETDPVWNEEKGDYYTKAQVYNKDEINDILGLTEEEVDLVTVIAAEDLSSWRVVYIDNGFARYFDPMDLNMVNFAKGITKQAVLQGNPIQVQVEGVFNATGLGLIPNKLYFAGANGMMVLFIEGYNVIQEVGNSISSESLNIEFGPATLVP